MKVNRKDVARLSLLSAAAIAILSMPARSFATGPVPLGSCQKIGAPGSYVLAGNIGATSRANSGGCIIVSSSFVTINLAGFVMSGDLKEPGIVYSGQSGTLTILNGTIKLFSVPVQAATASVRLDSLTIRDWNFANIPVIVGNNSLVTNDRFFYGNAAPTPPPSTQLLPDLQVGSGSTVMLNTFGEPPQGKVAPLLQIQCPSNILFNDFNEGFGQISTSNTSCNVFNNAMR